MVTQRRVEAEESAVGWSPDIRSTFAPCEQIPWERAVQHINAKHELRPALVHSPVTLSSMQYQSGAVSMGTAPVLCDRHKTLDQSQNGESAIVGKRL